MKQLFDLTFQLKIKEILTNNVDFYRIPCYTLINTKEEGGSMLKKLCNFKKEKKGFTLVELLAVIIILALIMALIIPEVTKTIEKSQVKSVENSTRGLIRAVNLAQKEYALDEELRSIYFKFVEGVESSNVDHLKLDYTGKRPKDGKIIIRTNGETYLAFYDGKYCIEKGYETEEITITKRARENCNLDIQLGDISGANAPQLLQGMTPIMWDVAKQEWIPATNIDDPEEQNWYDYGRKIWANARTLDGSMWVWIPRYAYQIASGRRTKVAGTINIAFLENDTNNPKMVIDGFNLGDSPIPETGDYPEKQTNYVVHPAFQFGAETLLGFWVAKFEPSGTASDVSIKPGQSPLVNQNINNQHITARSLQDQEKFGWKGSNVDTHMMKNIEWGAVAYLTQSMYGASKKIEINKEKSPMKTGGFNYIENVGQSTTHNIYGIYDMSGGAWERVMANLLICDENNNCSRSKSVNENDQSSNVDGFEQEDLNKINDKYIDEYKKYSQDIFGDAVFETSSGDSGANSWHGEYSLFLTNDYRDGYTRPWFTRGGDCGVSSSGVFSFSHSIGNSSGFYTTFRPVAVRSVGSVSEGTPEE